VFTVYEEMQMHTKQTQLYCTDKIIYMFQLMTAAIIRVITKTQNERRKATLVVRDRELNTPSVTQYTYLLTYLLHGAESFLRS